jgi:hypothetical protein
MRLSCFAANALGRPIAELGTGCGPGPKTASAPPGPPACASRTSRRDDQGDDQVIAEVAIKVPPEFDLQSKVSNSLPKSFGQPLAHRWISSRYSSNATASTRVDNSS